MQINMRVSNLERARSKIQSYFSNGDRKAYTTLDLQEIFHENHSSWRLAASTSYNKFVDFLCVDTDILRLTRLVHTSSGAIKKVYTNSEASNYDIICTIKKSGYLSYLSALVIHELTLQSPKTFYISDEIHKNYSTNSSLTQANVDKAFSKVQRKSSNIYKEEKTGDRYVFIEKKENSHDIGILKNGLSRFPVSDLERTLIDCTVRPQYSGGIFSVLEAFKNARKKIDINKMIHYLDELNYIYPYHQLIGFYLDRSGYSMGDLDLLKRRVTKLKFYITYNLNKKVLDKKWNIYYPEGI
jgi:predicted transcriptional regulator of viral defense system